MGITFDGITSQSKKISMRLTSWQAVPALRNSNVTVPGKFGVVDFGCDSAERIIEVECCIFPQKDFASLVKILDEAAEWLNPEKGLRQLVFGDVPDRYYMARLSDAVDCERLIRSAGAFTLRFVCPDPHAYALTDENYTIAASGSHTVRRDKGNTNSEPVYYLRGNIPSGTASYVSVKTNGEELRVTGSLGSAETLVIDTGKVTAKVVNAQGDTLRNGLPCILELNFPVLKKGSNTVSISTVGATFTELKIEAMSRWR